MLKDCLDVFKKIYDEEGEDYKYFKQLDYLSRLINTQKPIDSKKVIHSNNYLSFFIKKDNINIKFKLKLKYYILIFLTKNCCQNSFLVNTKKALNFSVPFELLTLNYMNMIKKSKFCTLLN